MVSVAAKKSKLVLNLLPEVADLPQNLTPDHKVYWNDFIGEPFQAHVGPRGKKSSNARTWTQELFVGPFCDELYPTLLQEARAQYEVILGPKVYSYLTNHSTRGSAGVKAKPQTVKQRVYGHDVWRRENPEVFEKALDDYKAQKPDAVISIGLRRSLTIDLFRKLPEGEQTKYRDMASDRLKTMKALQVMKGDDRAEYTKSLQAQLRTLIKEADHCAGLKINAQVLYEDDDGDFHITTLVTDCMVELAESEEVEKLIARMRAWVKETAGKGLLKNGIPAPTVYPDYERDMYPRPPPLIGLRAIEMQKVLRLEFILLWGWQGGSGRFPWELICANLDEFIASECRPENAILGDPSNLRISTVLTWLEYFHACLDPAFSPSKRTQFLKIFAGPNPIDPSLSQESSRRLEFVPSQNREVWVLFFSEPVTRCHAPNGLEYPPESIAYASYLRNSAIRTVPIVQSAQRSSFLGLPTGDSHPKAVILGQEKELILKWSQQLPEEYRRFVLELVDGINELQAHLPASTPLGIWVGQYLNSMPVILPASSESLIEGLQYFIHFWLPSGYFSPSAQTDLTSRFRYFQLYIEDMLSSPLIRHEPSNTLIGGFNGTVWLVRALILLVFNFAAVNGDLTPPHNPPSDCDITCLSLEELPNVLGYCQELLEAILKSIEILSQTSELRTASTKGSLSTQSQDPVAVPVHPSSPPSNPSGSSSNVSSTSSAAVNPLTRIRHGHSDNQKVPRKKRSKEPEGVLGSRESDESSVEQDYDKLDPHSSDDDEFNPNGYSGETDTGDTRSQARTTSTRFPDECSQIIRSDPSGSLQHHAFGPLHLIPRAVPQPLPRLYQDLHTSMGNAIDDLESTLRSWEELAKANSIRLNQEANLILASAKELPTPLQPLAYFVLARTRAWERAKVSAPHVIDFIPRFVSSARAALRLDVALEEFLEEETREATVGVDEYKTLDKLHKRLLKGGIEVCWVYKELLAFEKLSSEWSQLMPSNWLGDGGLPTNGPELYDLVKPLLEWAKASAELDGELRAHRQVMWRSTGRPFEARNKESLWYWFGNPKPDEMPDEFEACIKSIKAVVDEDDDLGSTNIPSEESPKGSGNVSESNNPIKKSSGSAPSKPKAKPKASTLPTSTRETIRSPRRTRQSAAQAAARESNGVALRSGRSTKSREKPNDGGAKARQR